MSAAMLTADPEGPMPSKADGPMPPEYEAFVATQIQAAYRGHSVRKQLELEAQAAAHIQREWRQSREASARAAPLSEEQAVHMIQRGWRRHAARKIYRYFRDMIFFRERGDPAQLLKAINPREASMLDAASGTHLRFRLGGTTFPPVIYYKIFTHRPVTDMCSFSPKDYTAQVNLAPKNLHSHEIPGVAEFVQRQNQSGWYQRVDNNGWRPLAEHVLIEVDPITSLTAGTRREYHHVPLVRQQQMAARRKQRQLEWMTKMYALGKTGGEPGDTGDTGDGVDEEGLSAEDRALLTWSSALDYNAYTEEWSTLATSQWSEDNVPLPSDFFDEEEFLPVIPIDGIQPYSTTAASLSETPRRNPQLLAT